MATWTPDPSFYPSPRMAMKAPPETLAYVAAFDPDRKTPDAIAVVDVDPKSQDLLARSSARRRCPTPATSCTISAGTPARSCLCPNAPHAARRAPLPGGAGPALLAHPHPRHQARSEEAEDRQGDRARRGRGQGRLHAAAHGALRAGGHLRRSARQPRGQGPGRRVPDGPRDLRGARPMGDRPRARSTSPTTPGGTSATTRWSPASGARPTPSRTG